MERAYEKRKHQEKKKRFIKIGRFLMAYQIEKDDKKWQFQKKEKLNGITIKPKVKERKNYVMIDKIVVVNKSFQQKALSMEFNLAFRRILKQLMAVTENDDSTDGDVKIVFDEIMKMKKILKEKYQHELEIEEYHTMWKKACFLEQEIKNYVIKRRKIEEYKYEQQYEEERGRGR